jgi:hypothetical protein
MKRALSRCLVLIRLIVIGISITTCVDYSSGIPETGDLDLVLGTRWLRHEGAQTWTSFKISKGSGSQDRNRMVDMNGDKRIETWLSVTNQ